MRKLTISCLAAICALGLASCSTDKDPETTDGGPDGSVKSKCRPQCRADEYCDETQEPPMCINLCTQTGDPCPGTEVCDTSNKDNPVCAAPKCGNPAVQCGEGQGCFDPTDDLFGAGSVCTCRPEVLDPDTDELLIEDSCKPYGMVCGFNKDTRAPATCRKPRAFEECQSAIGCETGSDCRTINSDYRICLQACTSGAQCDDPMTACYPGNYSVSALRGHCYYNYCARPTQTPADRAKYYGACDATNTGDGTCVPLPTRDASGTQIDIGICFAGGTAPSLGKCDPDGDRKTMSGLCPQFQMCTSAIQPAASGNKGEGLCKKLCNAAPGPGVNPDPTTVPNAACDATTTGGPWCMDVSGADSATSLVATRLGFCSVQCDVFGATNTCPADALGNVQDCWPMFQGTTGYCKAQKSGAADAYTTCTPVLGADGFERRNGCKDAAACLEASEGATEGLCLPWCNLNTCNGGNTTACSMCGGTNNACSKLSSSQNVAANPIGLCVPMQ